MMKYYHGGYGGLKKGDKVLPPSVTGALTTADYGAGSVCNRNKVYITTDKAAAMLLAKLVPNGKCYRVKPHGDLLPDPDAITGASFECEFAVVEKVFYPENSGKDLYVPPYKRGKKRRRIRINTNI